MRGIRAGAGRTKIVAASTDASAAPQDKRAWSTIPACAPEGMRQPSAAWPPPPGPVSAIRHQGRESACGSDGARDQAGCEETAAACRAWGPFAVAKTV